MTNKQKLLRILLRLLLATIIGTEQDSKLLLTIMQSTIRIMFGDVSFTKSIVLGSYLESFNNNNEQFNHE